MEKFFEQFFGDPPELKGLFEKYSQPCEFEAKIEAHLTRLIQTNPPKMDRRIFIELPEFKEEARRIDAAMPRQTAIGEPTPVQVLICLPKTPRDFRHCSQRILEEIMKSKKGMCEPVG